MPRPLDLDHQIDGFVDLVARHVALVAVFDGAARLDRHRDIDHPGGRRLVQGCLALELGADQIGAASDRTPNQIRADAERVGIGDRWNAGYPLGRPICEFLPVGAGRVEHCVGRYPRVEASAPLAEVPLVKRGMVWSQYLYLLSGIACSTSRPTKYFMNTMLTSPTSIALDCDRN